MEDILDQLRDSRLNRPPQRQREININDLSAHNKAHAAYDHLRWRLNWGLPGSIVLMLVVAALAPYYVHSLPYFVCYAVVQLITIVRVMIAVQMYIAIRHLDPTRPVAEVNAYADRMTLLQRFNHHYTLYIKLPLTVCLGPLFGPPMGFDFFSYKWVLYLWIVLCVVLLSLNAWGIVRSFRKLDAAIENIDDRLWCIQPNDGTHTPHPRAWRGAGRGCLTANDQMACPPRHACLGGVGHHKRSGCAGRYRPLPLLFAGHGRFILPAGEQLCVGNLCRRGHGQGPSV